MKEIGHGGETEGMKEPLTKWERERKEQARENNNVAGLIPVHLNMKG